MIFQREDIVQLSRAVCETMLDLPMESADPHAPVDRTPYAPTCTRIAGPWNGAVTLNCSMTVASHAAASMFCKTIDELTEDDRRDAMLELANIVGGNIKSLLPQTSTLSLPTLLSSGDMVEQFPGSRLILCVTIPAHGHELSVSVLELAA